ncbi:MAG: hypothetical protein CMB52_00580 [Euryarchaeota archaeon]|nr:hypothetical protein [Euryarchaeota archaeon]
MKNDNHTFPTLPVLPDSARRRVSNGGILMEHKISVQIADKTGHTQLMLSPAETVEAIQQNSSAWIYADNKLVQPSMVDEENLTTVSSVRILPGLVGGY